jgi:hypothetical protein
LSQAIYAGSRRAALQSLSLAAGSTLASLLGVAATEAKKKRKKRKKKPGSPALQLAYECPGPPESVGTFLLISRVAQVFAAERSGTLRRIQFHINKDAGSAGDYVVQLVRVDSGTPSSVATHILAGITIPNADVPDGESTLAADFLGPELTAGTEYAAAIGRVANSIELGNFTGTGNICAGQTFASMGGAFTESPTLDVVVSVFVG